MRIILHTDNDLPIDDAICRDVHRLVQSICQQLKLSDDLTINVVPHSCLEVRDEKTGGPLGLRGCFPLGCYSVENKEIWVVGNPLDEEDREGFQNCLFANHLIHEMAHAEQHHLHGGVWEKGIDRRVQEVCRNLGILFVKSELTAWDWIRHYALTATDWMMKRDEA